MTVWYVIGELGSLAEHTAPAELNANIRLEPGKHELTAEEIAAAKANTAAIANGYGLCLVGVPGGRGSRVVLRRRRDRLLSHADVLPQEAGGD